jgi:hypothetical protein
MCNDEMEVVHLIGERVQSLRDMLEFEGCSFALRISAAEHTVDTNFLVDPGLAFRLLGLLYDCNNDVSKRHGYQIVVIAGTEFVIRKRTKRRRRKLVIGSDGVMANAFLTAISYTDNAFVKSDIALEESRKNIVYVGYYSLSNAANDLESWRRDAEYLIFTRPNRAAVETVVGNPLYVKPGWCTFDYSLMHNLLVTTVKGEPFVDQLEYGRLVLGDDEMSIPMRVFIGLTTPVGTLQVHLTMVELHGFGDTARESNPFATPFSDFSLMLGILWNNRGAGFVGRYDFRRSFFEKLGFDTSADSHDLFIPGPIGGVNVSGHAMSLGPVFYSGFTVGVKRYLAYIISNMLDYDTAEKLIFGASDVRVIYAEDRAFEELGNAAPGELWHTPVEYYLGFYYAAEAYRKLNPERHQHVTAILTFILNALTEANNLLRNHQEVVSPSVSFMQDIVGMLG